MDFGIFTNLVSKMDRRAFCRGVARLTACAGLARLNAAQHIARGDSGPPHFNIDHVIVVMMENRSFDHLFGWLPNSDGKQAGMSYSDASGVAHASYPLAPNYTGCSFRNPDHSYAGGRIQYQNGAMNGFLLDTANDAFAIGYYQAPDLPFLSALATEYTTIDHYHCSVLGPTYPNRIFLHAAQTDRLTNSTELCTLPTIWDSLDHAGVTARYYYNNASFLGLWGTKYLDIVHPYSDFLSDASSGNLPAVAFVDPRFTLLENGDGNDFEPPSDIRAGDAFLAQTFQAVSSGPSWKTSALIIVFDEWGGFFEHVPPPRIIAPNQTDPDLVDGRALLGFRVPAIVASPFTRGSPANPRVNHLLYDHTSILKFIEWRWNLPPLTARDASDEINNLERAFHWFPFYEVPDLPQPVAPQPQACSST